MNSIIKGLITTICLISNAMAQTITSVEPDSAYQGETLTVTITGQNTNFTAGSGTVHLSFTGPDTIGSDAISVTSFTVMSDTILNADFDIPFDASTGFWNVFAPDQLVGIVTLDSGFTIYATSLPILISALPDNAEQGDNLTVTITGRNTNFAQGSGTTNVWFSQGDSTLNSTSFTIISNLLLNADFNIPVDAPTGFWDVNVLDEIDGTMTYEGGFRVNPPSPIITFVNPDSAVQGTSLTVSITGQNTNFTSGGLNANLWFTQGSETINATVVSASNDTLLDADFDIPGLAPAGKWNVSVSDNDDGIIYLNDGFTILPTSLPTLISVVPDNSVQGDSLTVSITGRNTNFTSGGLNASLSFTQGSETININAVIVSASNDTLLDADFNIPIDASIGLWNVSVLDNDDGILYLNDGFRVNPPPPPPSIITSVEPDSAYQGENLTITITGQNTKFTTGSGTVHLSSKDETTSINAATFTVINDSLLNADFDIPFDALIGLWNVKAPDEFVGFVTLDSGFIIYDNTIDIELESDQNIPSAFKLSQNFPNPFNPVTVIKYALPAPSEVLLAIYNLTGEEVARLVNKNQQEGYHKVTWNASSFASGIYFYRLQAGDFVQTRKMVLLK